MTKRNRTFLISTGFFLTLIASGCIKSTDPGPIPARTYVSVMHLAPNSPAVDVWFDAERVSTNPFTPGSVSGAYNRLDVGNYVISFKKNGGDSVVATLPAIAYDSLHYYTILLFNQNVNGPVHAIRIEDDFSTVVLTKPVYRFFHASPNTVGVDLYMDNIKIENGRMPGDNVTQFALNNFKETTSGMHTFQVKAVGTDSVIVSRNDLELGPGNAYTIYLKGLTGGTGSSQLSIEMLRAVN